MRLYLLLIIVSIFVLNCAISINNIRDYGSQGDYSNLVKHGKYSKNEDIRVATVEELRKIRKEESCIDLIDMASDESYKVKLAVCSALSKRLECKGAVSTIIKFTKDVQPRLRKHAKEVLIENKIKDYWHGYTENYIKVKIPITEKDLVIKPNIIIDILIKKAYLI